MYYSVLYINVCGYFDKDGYFYDSLISQCNETFNAKCIGRISV